MQNRWYKHVAIIGDSKIDCYATYSDGDIKALQVHNGFKKLDENSIAQNKGGIITILELVTDVELLEELGNPDIL